MSEFYKKLYNLSRGVESLTPEEHGRFFDTVQRLGLPDEVKKAAVVLYLDFKDRPIGEYNAERKNLDIFLTASISLAAKVLGEFRTDQEFESKVFVGKEKLADAEERILRSFQVQDNVRPLPELLSQLARRQIESIAEGFAQRGLIGTEEKEALVARANSCIDAANVKGLSPKMSYRGRAAAALHVSVDAMGLRVSDTDIARAAGFDKKTMKANAKTIGLLIHE